MKNKLLRLFGSSQKQETSSASVFDELHEIGIALAAEKNIDTLLELILNKSRKLLSADAGSIFLAEGPNRENPTHLRFKLAQNESVPFEFKEIVIPINLESLAGYVASKREHLLIDDVYSIPASYPFRFYGAMDEKTGYRSRSLLSIPMVDHRNHLIGVVQVWNKIDSQTREVSNFTQEDLKLLKSVAAQAGVALENAYLYEEINNLFKGFIRASVKAIEARDPTTSGHSERVAKLMLGLAEAVDRTPNGPYHNIQFSEKDYKEFEYAALLHDFGKIGVRESVLVKAKKLYPVELELIQSRLDVLYRTTELKLKAQQIQHLEKGGKKEDAKWLEIEKQALMELAQIDETRSVIETSNEPTILPEDISKELFGLKKILIALPKGNEMELVTESQLLRLAVRKGSLSDAERQEIESHVSHTFRFLEEIPWTQDLKNVPTIAFAHHEKLDGTGYPRGLKSSEIPFPSKIMAVVDIFDALTARDRPYKRAIPVTKALEILEMEVKMGQLDSELLRLFIEAKVFERTAQGD